MKGSLVLVSALLVALFGAPAEAQDFDLEEAVGLCAGCHGEAGVPVEQDIPILWGQEFYYIYVQLKDYKAGRRANEIMQPIAGEYDKAQMKAIAQHFAEKEWPSLGAGKDSSLATSGKTQTAAGQCAQCHSTYKGDSRVPRVAGQSEQYLTRTMLEFKHKVRLNSPAKSTLMKSYDDQALKEMAHFLATL